MVVGSDRSARPVTLELAYAMACSPRFSEDGMPRSWRCRLILPCSRGRETAQVPLLLCTQVGAALTRASRQQRRGRAGDPDGIRRFRCRAEVEEKVKRGARVLMVAHSDRVVTSEDPAAADADGVGVRRIRARGRCADPAVLREQEVQITSSPRQSHDHRRVARGRRKTATERSFSSRLHVAYGGVRSPPRPSTISHLWPGDAGAESTRFKRSRRRGIQVMVGDGVNDVLALKEA